MLLRYLADMRWTSRERWKGNGRLPMPGPFRVPAFRYQWPADLLTNCAFEMETLILGWWILTETGSVRLLTAYGALYFFGTMVAPMFGTVTSNCTDPQ